MDRTCGTCKSFMNPFDRYICESCIRNDHYSPAPKAFWKTDFDKYKYNEEEMAMVKLSKPPMVPISIERKEGKMTSKETLCTNCAHLEVCSLKEYFLDATRALDELMVPYGDNGRFIKLSELDWISSYITCRHFLANPINIRQ